MAGVNDFFLFINPPIFPYFLNTFYQNVYSHLHYNLISAFCTLTENCYIHSDNVRDKTNSTLLLFCQTQYSWSSLTQPKTTSCNLPTPVLDSCGSQTIFPWSSFLSLFLYSSPKLSRCLLLRHRSLLPEDQIGCLWTFSTLSPPRPKSSGSSIELQQNTSCSLLSSLPMPPVDPSLFPPPCTGLLFLQSPTPASTSLEQIRQAGQ